MKHITLLILGTILTCSAFGRDISGTVVDSSTGEALIGATVYVKQLPKTGTTTGLDGTFKLSTDLKEPILVCSYLGYQTQIVNDPHHSPLVIKLNESAAELSEVVVTASVSNTESGARMIERNSMNVVKVWGAVNVLALVQWNFLPTLL